MNVKGTVIKYGDNVDTDVIIPARYLNTSDKKELASHCMEDLDKTFVTRVKPGDMMVAGNNFGCGSSREHAPIAIKESGISLVIAKSFASPARRARISSASLRESDCAYQAIRPRIAKARPRCVASRYEATRTMSPPRPEWTIHQPMAPCAPPSAPRASRRGVQPAGMRFVSQKTKKPAAQTSPTSRPSRRCDHSHQ